jgi:uncharacterized protein YdeI (YjbR/CyaY-like superfamily)
MGVGPGDMVVRVEHDDTPGAVEVPADVGWALTDSPAVAEIFDGLSFTQCKEHARCVGDAKREQTRLTRAAIAVTMLI